MKIKHYFFPKSPLVHVFSEKIEALSRIENLDELIGFLRDWQSWDNHEQVASR
jgi:hypothetical protein